jgi:hypothetical protein
MEAVATALLRIAAAVEAAAVSHERFGVSYRDVANAIEAFCELEVDSLTPLRRACYRGLRIIGVRPYRAMSIIQRYAPQLF